MLYTSTIIVETLCLLASFYLLRGKNMEWWRYFKWFLLLTVVVEIVGYLLYFVFHKSNHTWFNFYLPVEVAFIFWVFYKISLARQVMKLLVVSFYILFAIFYLREGLDNSFLIYNATSNEIASISIIILCGEFYYTLLKREEFILINRDASFWIVCGLFLFYFGSTTCNLFSKQLMQIYAHSGIPVRYFIMLVLNVILYGCWTYAFTCKYRQKISSSLSSQ